MISVLTPLPIDKLLTYRWQGDGEAHCGTLVDVEVGRRRVTGCVWRDDDDKKSWDENRLKEASQIAGAPRFGSDFMSFLQWTAHWSYNARGLILKMALGASLRLKGNFDASDAVEDKTKGTSFDLTQEQQTAWRRLIAKKSGVVLLDGVTGSGKTLVYMEAMAHHMASGGQVLVLLPEIALVPQWLSVFEGRFGFTPLLWHSQLTPRMRRHTWFCAAAGNASVLVGTRSALFLPLPRVSLIVVDEEHDTSYKQEQGVIYHGRDMAIARAHHEGIPIVLTSATPSLETAAHVASGKYDSVPLKNRYQGRLATIHTIDMRRHGATSARSDIISPPLQKAIHGARARGRQCLLFVNRRGYAPLTLCRSCGHRVTGPQCENSLVWHVFRKKLLCHYCGYEQDKPSHCPECGKKNLILVGMGVERLEEEANRLFAGEVIRVISSDRMAKKSALETTLKELRDGTIGIAIGTQMIAKGHHFPHLGLVGVIDADMGLASDDLRAAERCYQTLHQVGGRAGRENQDGEIYVQTYQPHHAVIEALCSYDRDRFVSLELKGRQRYGLPPYGRLAAVIVSGRNGAQVEEVAKSLAKSAPQHKEIRLYDAVPAPIFIVAGRRRWRLLVSTQKTDYALASYMRLWLGQKKTPSSVKIEVDIDPMHFL